MNLTVFLTDKDIVLKNIDSLNIANLHDFSSLNKYNSYILDNTLDSSLKSKIVSYFSLSTEVRIFKQKLDYRYLISSLCSINSSITKEDGIQKIIDSISALDLEIEKTARVAYELCEDTLLVLDASHHFLSSRLFRKVFNEVNEDYPKIYRIDSDIDNLNYYLDREYKYIATEGLFTSLVLNSLLYKDYLLDIHYLSSDIQKQFYIAYSIDQIEHILEFAQKKI